MSLIAVSNTHSTLSRNLVSSGLTNEVKHFQTLKDLVDVSDIFSARELICVM